MLAGSRCDLCAECTHVVTLCTRCNPSRNAMYFPTMILARSQPSHDQDRVVLGAVKALAALDPTGYGLDGASAQLEGRIYVMTKEARLQFGVDRGGGQSYREDLVGAIAHPSAVLPDAERCSQRS